MLAVVALVVAVASAATHAAFVDRAENSGNTFAVVTSSSDTQAPPIASATLAKDGEGVAQRIKPGGGYHVYADVGADLGDPASGTASVTADASLISSGQSAAALASGSYPLGAVTFNWRTALLAAGSNSALSGCGYHVPVTATDNASNAGTAFARRAMVDRDMLSDYNVRIDGAAGGDGAGYSLAGAGDVNGDGRPDALVGAYQADNNGRTDSGSAYVIFGRAANATIDLANLGSDGYRIDGATAGERTGVSVADAGDVNGDGLNDQLVGADDYGGGKIASAGAASVVFGKATTTAIDLANLGSDGYRIDGAASGDDTGFSVSNAGDVNGDGRPDALVGAPLVGKWDNGAAYVVFGKTTTTTVDVANLGSDGYAINGAADGDRAGWSVANLGDVNGDGRADAVVSAYQADNNARSNSGSAYVVFGQSTTTAIDLANLGSGGYRIDGAAADDYTGVSVSDAGDVNGDGRPDALVGALYDRANAQSTGTAYVVFGKTTTTAIDLATLGSDGYRIDDADMTNDKDRFVANAGDVNGDGRPDALIAASKGDHNARTDSGSAYVVFGKTTTTAIDLANLGSSGYRIDGAAAGDQAGHQVAGAGDVNGDGRPDALVATIQADNNARTDSGSAYLVNLPACGYRDTGLGTSGMLSYYRLGESSGTAAADQKGGPAGTYSGLPSLGQAGAIAEDPNTAVLFDGVNDEMATSNASLALSTNATIEGWFDVTSGVSLLRDNTSTGGWILAYNSSGKIAYRVAGTTFLTTRDFSTLGGGWHHVVLTKAGGDTALYIDGKRVHSGTLAAVTPAVLPWYVMRNGGYADQLTAGRADDVAFYDRALSAAEVANRYKWGFPDS